MNKEKAFELIAALRSGKYEQCAGRLHDEEGGYCCLGVASDLAVKRGVGREEIESNGAGYFFTGSPESKYDGNGSSSTLPRFVALDLEWNTTRINWAVGSFREVPKAVAWWALRDLEIIKRKGWDKDEELCEDLIADLKDASSLASKNDNGASFADIADFLEEFWDIF